MTTEEAEVKWALEAGNDVEDDVVDAVGVVVVVFVVVVAVVVFDYLFDSPSTMSLGHCPLPRHRRHME